MVGRFELGDFTLFAIAPAAVRVIAGFAQAASITPESWSPSACRARDVRVPAKRTDDATVGAIWVLAELPEKLGAYFSASWILCGAATSSTSQLLKSLQAQANRFVDFCYVII